MMDGRHCHEEFCIRGACCRLPGRGEPGTGGAPAAAAPSGPGTVQDTVNSLQASGYQVIVSKVGNAPLEKCTVTAVRPGQTYSRTDSGVPGAGNDVVTTVTNQTVYVDVRC